LYELTQGVPDIVVKLFCLAQARAVLLASTPEDETLSPELLEQVFEDEFSIVKPLLDALRTGNKKKLEDCNDLIFPKFESSMINAMDKLVSQPLEKPKTIELGEPDETNMANSAIQTIVAMGISEDIAKPLVTDALARKPDLTLIQIIQMATTALTQTGEEKTRKPKVDSKPVYTKRESWGQLPKKDLRKMYADKSGSMYEVMKEKGLIYPVHKLLAG
jgi:hypothetical protein